ncbi:hypothetical protein AwPolaro_01050 [Polaromonas sp.]|nr:hypothetical protein AwPolaro_01050 [Polaromonas sp.]
MPNSAHLTPQERLALSRQALLGHMNRHRHDSVDGLEDVGASSGPILRGMARRLKRAVRSWWYHHPASVAVELLRPLLADYAGTQPGKLLALAAGLGAVAVWTRPWRMISVKQLTLAGIKASGLSSIVLSLLTSRSSAAQNNEGNP